MIIHWIINPGLAINELVLGQRVPKLQLEDKTSEKPRIERTLVPCPHCGTLHDGRTWSTQNGTAFKNWFGLYCPNCGKVIPCVMNAFSLLILTLTIPIWWWFGKKIKEKWLSKQPARYQNIEFTYRSTPFDKKNWIHTGLGFGITMFVLMSLLFPLISNEPITWRSLLFGIISWMIGGLVYSYIMKVFLERKGHKEKKLVADRD